MQLKESIALLERLAKSSKTTQEQKQIFKYEIEYRLKQQRKTR